MLAADEIVLVRGRVDHKEAGKVCIVVQDVERFDPSERRDREGQGAGRRGAPRARCPSDCACASTPRRLPPTVIDELRDLFERYPGEAEFVLEMQTRAGLRRLRFGDGFRVAGRNAAPEVRARPCSARRGVARAAA